MTDTNNLHKAINSQYDNSLDNKELFEAGINLLGFFELLIEIDMRNKKQSKGKNKDEKM